jgi:PhzF family phenazine biosynthesis protein
MALATLTSVEPRDRDAPADLLDAALTHLGWTRDDLEPAIPAALAFAGAWHLVLPLASRATLARMTYDFDAMRGLMEANDLTTVQVVWREDAHTFHARDPFAVGGVVEDPATGAAAAALGGLLRSRSLVDVPADVVIHQGHDMGRPSRLDVHIPEAGGIRVSGTAVPLD